MQLDAGKRIQKVTKGNLFVAYILQTTPFRKKKNVCDSLFLIPSRLEKNMQTETTSTIEKSFCCFMHLLQPSLCFLLQRQFIVYKSTDFYTNPHQGQNEE